MTNRADAGVRYFFVVARRHPDIFGRVQERLHGDPRIEVITDRRYGERRRAGVPQAGERRTRDRRRPTNIWNDLTVYPTLVAQRHVDSYAELEDKLERLRADNARLRDEIADLGRRLGAQVAAEAEFKADVASLLTQAEQTLGELIASFRRFARQEQQPEHAQQPEKEEPRLRSV